MIPAELKPLSVICAFGFVTRTASAARVDTLGVVFFTFAVFFGFAAGTGFCLDVDGSTAVVRVRFGRASGVVSFAVFPAAKLRVLLLRSRHRLELPPTPPPPQARSRRLLPSLVDAATLPLPPAFSLRALFLPPPPPLFFVFFFFQLQLR